MKRKSMIGTAVVALTVGLVATTFADGGAAFTAFNTAVDGDNVCRKQNVINCNIYRNKQYVWLNGGPLANGLGPDGDYFFAVLEPSGQPNPNDGPPGNLSSYFDYYTNRTFSVSEGEVSAYGGGHDLDSGASSSSPRGPDDIPPYIRVSPYADTTNPGGGYILAICSLANGYPVDPRDCKYDFFTVRED